LKALFNFGIKRSWELGNPTRDIPFFPVEKRIKYVPSQADVRKVIIAASPDTQAHLWTKKETLGRVSEKNRLTWADVSLSEGYVILYARKEKGGNLTPRKIPMTNRLFEVLSNRYKHRDPKKPWVFWHRYRDRKTKAWSEGPYPDRKKVMSTLCQKAGVKYFRFHGFRHFGASVLDSANVNIGSIQRILGHENRTATKIYLHSIGESEREAWPPTKVSWKNHTQSHTQTKKGVSPSWLTPRFYWSRRSDLNRGPADYESAALPLSYAGTSSCKTI
jgi:integrase